MRIIISAAFVLVSVSPLVAAKGQGGSVSGGATPRQVFDNALEANRQGDLKTLVALVGPSERGRVVLELFDGAAGLCAEDPAQDLCELLRRYGLEEAMKSSAEAQEAEFELDFNERMAQQIERASTIFAKVDVPSLAEDLRTAFIALGAPDDEALFTYEKLDSIKIDGDTAVAFEGERRIEFLREGGRWYFRWRAIM